MTTTIKVVTCTNSECAFECMGEHPEVTELLSAGFTPLSVNTTPGFERWSISFVGDVSKLKNTQVKNEEPIEPVDVVDEKSLEENAGVAAKQHRRKTPKKTRD